MSRLLSIAAGRRSKWVVFAVWLLALFISFGANLPGKFTEAEDNESTSFLPGDAESTKALEATTELQDGERAAIVVVYRREGGLTPEDQRYVGEQREALN